MTSSLFQVLDGNLKPIPDTSFDEENLLERAHIQAMLEKDIQAILPDTMIVSSEYGDFEDSKRRIDLLCVDCDANLVVVEIKRTNDGGHLELQAIRYAAMVSKMTWNDLVNAYKKYKDLQTEEGAQAELEAFITSERGSNGAETEIAFNNVKIVLISADFSKEVMTTVMWLSEANIDITCIKLSPYKFEDKVLVHAQKIFPLPEAEDFQIKIRKKSAENRELEQRRHIFRRKWWTSLFKEDEKADGILKNRSPSERSYISMPSCISGISYNYEVTRNSSTISLYIDVTKDPETKNKQIFDNLYAHKDLIDKLFMKAVDWERLDNRRASRVSLTSDTGYDSPEHEWPKTHKDLISNMNILKKNLDPILENIKKEMSV